jgi:hypothetical protein
MQRPEKYKENFDVSSEDPSCGITSEVSSLTPDEMPSLETAKFSLIYFSGSCIPTNESLFTLLALPTLVHTVQGYFNL